MELKRTSNNPYSKEKSAPPEMNWGIRERCFYEGVDAQLEADQQTLEAAVDGIFEEIEERLFTFDADGNLILTSAPPRDRIVAWWQALKQKYVKEVKGDRTEKDK